MASKATLLAWLGETLGRTFDDLKGVASVDVARVLHAMHGDAACPLTHVRFAADHAANTDAALRLARGVGFDGKLTAAAWAEQTDFANLIVFFRWLHQDSLEHPIPADYDFNSTFITPPAPAPRAAIAGGGSGSYGARDSGDTAGTPLGEPDYGLPASAAPPALGGRFFPADGDGKENAVAACGKCGKPSLAAAEVARLQLRTLREAHDALLDALAEGDPRKIGLALQRAQLGGIATGAIPKD